MDYITGKTGPKIRFYYSLGVELRCMVHGELLGWEINKQLQRWGAGRTTLYMDWLGLKF